MKTFLKVNSLTDLSLFEASNQKCPTKKCWNKIEAVHTLLVFDEIQEVPKALIALKYFCENAKEYAIIAAGQEQMVELAEEKDYDLINAFADKYTDLLRKYYYVGGMPLISYMGMSSFKIYMSDVGLLGARCNLDAITLLEGNDIFTEFRGALTEQFVAHIYAIG